ncbi:MAG: winged helix-turn-helix domain-containing protein [Deltaproteobacteria bacterium]|nr:winged helix-turn-helix domain-containing protein [Deltaproteobacteria bacterium]
MATPGSITPSWFEATLAAGRLLGWKETGSWPPLARPEPASAAPDRRADYLAASFRCRLALLELRPGRARVSLKQLEQRLDPERLAERHERDTLELWTLLMAGEPGFTSARVDALTQRARAHGRSEQVVELTALGALAQAQAGDIEQGMRLARVASRMARTEELPQPAILANLILARVRRLDGSPYLAARIASSLRRFAPSSFRPWIDWELVLATGDHAELPADAGREARELSEALRACAVGDHERVSERLDALKAHACGLVRADVSRLRAALLPSSAESLGDAALESWQAGVSDVVPHGLAGLCLGDRAQLDSVSIVVSEPGRAYRLLERASPLLIVRGAILIGSEAGAQLRSVSVLAAVALAGGRGLEEQELFRQVYGFHYKSEIHRGTFNTVLHRARGVLGRAGSLLREDGRVRLTHEGTLILPDPRCSLGTRDRVLRFLATVPRISARRIADELELPLRSVQAMLRELVDEGVCSSLRDGRRIAYVVEDTTFHEPTQRNPLADEDATVRG